MAERCEVDIFRRPGRIVLGQGFRLLGRSAAWKDAGAPGEGRRTPFAQRRDVGRAFLGKEVASEVVAPAQQRHLELDARLVLAGRYDDVIRRAVLEAIAGGDREIISQRAEPESS